MGGETQLSILIESGNIKELHQRTFTYCEPTLSDSDAKNVWEMIDFYLVPITLASIAIAKELIFYSTIANAQCEQTLRLFNCAISMLQTLFGYPFG